MVKLKVGLQVQIGSELGRICKKQGSDFVVKMTGGRLVGVDERTPMTIIMEGAESTTSASGSRVSTAGRRQSRDSASVSEKEEVVVETAKPRRKKATRRKKAAKAKAKRSAPKRKAAAKRKAAPTRRKKRR